MSRQMTSEEDVGDREGGIFAEVTERNVSIASLFQLVLRYTRIYMSVERVTERESVCERKNVCVCE